MKETSKKCREDFWVNRLREISKLNFEIDDPRCKRESPDCLIRFEGRIIGLEVCELQIDQNRNGMNGSILQREFSLGQKIILMAKEKYFAEFSHPINVTVHLDPGYGQSLAKYNPVEIACNIVDIIHQVELKPNEQRRLDFDTNPPTQMPISFLYIYDISENKRPDWKINAPGWVKKLLAEDIEPLLNAKNALISEYQKTVLENWLLIAADGTTPPGMFGPPDQRIPNLPQSKFDRTFFICEPDYFFEWP